MTHELDLRGVRCPLNWARAKARLEELDREEILSLLVDDERGVRDIPRAAEMEGFVVIDVSPSERAWKIVIQR